MCNRHRSDLLLRPEHHSRQRDDHWKKNYRRTFDGSCVMAPTLPHPHGPISTIMPLQPSVCSPLPHACVSSTPHLAWRHMRHTRPRQCSRECKARSTVPAGARTKVLPSGLALTYYNEDELVLLHNEILGPDCTYLQGVELSPGDVVIDVGANIGLFCIRAAQDVGPNGRVICIEPSSEACAAADANFTSHQTWCAQRGMQACVPELITAAAGASLGPPVTFHFYPRAMGWSCLEPDAGEVRANMQAYLEHLLAQPSVSNSASIDTGSRTNTSASSTNSSSGTSTSTDSSMSTSSDETSDRASGTREARGHNSQPENTQQALLPYSNLIQAARLLRRVAPLRGLVNAAQWVAVEWMLASRRTVSVPQTTVSEVIRTCGLQRVDLLKVDVERGEYDVLLGIDDSHWPLIRQISMEVHFSHVLADKASHAASDGRNSTSHDPHDRTSGAEMPSELQGSNVEAMQRLLQSKGLSHVRITQEANMSGTNLFMLHAWR